MLGGGGVTNDNQRTSSVADLVRSASVSLEGGGGMYISSNICNGGKNDKYLLNRVFLCLVSL